MCVCSPAGRASCCVEVLCPSWHHMLSSCQMRHDTVRPSLGWLLCRAVKERKMSIQRSSLRSNGEMGRSRWGRHRASGLECLCSCLPPACWGTSGMKQCLPFCFWAPPACLQTDPSIICPSVCCRTLWICTTVPQLWMMVLYRVLPHLLRSVLHMLRMNPGAGPLHNHVALRLRKVIRQHPHPSRQGQIDRGSGVLCEGAAEGLPQQEINNP